MVPIFGGGEGGGGVEGWGEGSGGGGAEWQAQMVLLWTNGTDITYTQRRQGRSPTVFDRSDRCNHKEKHGQGSHNVLL